FNLERIDEEEEYEFPTSPSPPKIQVPGKPQLDVIVVKLPCDKSWHWLRDEAHLHLQIEAAKLATTSKGLRPVWHTKKLMQQSCTLRIWGSEQAGWKIHAIKRIRNPKAEPGAYNEWNYNKFCL
ncbi:hypothetical protein RYX36_021018, partial [Vicia faba]